MVQSAYRFAAPYKQPRVFGGILSLPTLFKWTPSLALWGGTLLGGVLFFADSIPLYRHNILQKVPGIGWYYDDSVDPEDTPF